jgi:hypothetical protein
MEHSLVEDGDEKETYQNPTDILAK